MGQEEWRTELEHAWREVAQGGAVRYAGPISWCAQVMQELRWRWVALDRVQLEDGTVFVLHPGDDAVRARADTRWGRGRCLALVGLPPRRDQGLLVVIGPQGLIRQRLLREGAGVVAPQPLLDGAALVCGTARASAGLRGVSGAAGVSGLGRCAQVWPSAAITGSFMRSCVMGHASSGGNSALLAAGVASFGRLMAMGF